MGGLFSSFPRALNGEYFLSFLSFLSFRVQCTACNFLYFHVQCTMSMYFHVQCTMSTCFHVQCTMCIPCAMHSGHLYITRTMYGVSSYAYNVRRDLYTYIQC